MDFFNILASKSLDWSSFLYGKILCTSNQSFVRSNIEVHNSGTVIMTTSGLGTIYKTNDGMSLLVKSSNNLYLYTVSETEDGARMYNSKSQSIGNQTGTVVYNGTTYYYRGFAALGGVLTTHENFYVYDGSTNVTDMITALLDYYFMKT